MSDIVLDTELIYDCLKAIVFGLGFIGGLLFIGLFRGRWL